MMNQPSAVSTRSCAGAVLGWLCFMCLTSAMIVPAATYNEEDVVEDFTLYARRSFTNDLGTTIPAGSPVRLTDFEGKIVFMEFFYYW